MTHPRRAARDPLKGATRAAWQSQLRRVHGWDTCSGEVDLYCFYLAKRFLVSASASQKAATA
jgi:uncharacterized protein (DUF2132 family)